MLQKSLKWIFFEFVNTGLFCKENKVEQGSFYYFFTGIFIVKANFSDSRKINIVHIKLVNSFNVKIQLT